MNRLLGMCVLVALTACKKVSPESFLLPDEEKQLEAALLRDLQSDAGRVCKRDVLRGAATPGAGAAELKALVLREGANKACFDLVASKEGVAAIDAIVGDTLPSGRGKRVLGYTLAMSAPLPAGAAAGLATLTKACGGLQAAIAKAVSYGDGCSPFIPGKSNDPKVTGAFMIGKAAAALARVDADSAPPLASVQRLLDVVRLSQDLARGGTTLIVGMAATVVPVRSIAVLEELLASPRLGKGELEVIAKELDLLARSDVEPRSHLKADRVESELLIMYKPLKGPAFQVPGSPPPEPAAPAAKPTKDVKPLFKVEAASGDPRVDSVLAWAASRQAAEKSEAACAAAPSVAACVNAIGLLQDEARARAQRPKAGPSDPKLMRQHIFDVLTGIAGTSPRRYFQRLAQRSFFIDAMRLHVAARLDALAGKPVDAASLAKRAASYRDVYAGAPLEVSADVSAPSSFAVRPKTPLAIEKAAEVVYVAKVPAAAASPPVAPAAPVAPPPAKQ